MLKLASITNFKQITDTLIPLAFVEMHLNNNEINVSMVDTAAVCMVIGQYKCEVFEPTTLKFDLEEIRKIKVDVVDIFLDNNIIIIQSGNTKYKLPMLSDPRATSRDPPNKTWEYTDINIPQEHIKQLAGLFDQEKEYWLVSENNNLNIHDCEKDKMSVEMDIPCEVTAIHSTKLGGHHLVDVFHSYKHFTDLIISLGTDTPVAFVFKNENITIKYLLAPRIESD